MKAYIRKIDSQCITHQISITREVVSTFFDNVPDNTSINFVGAKSKKIAKVTVLYATDPRFGGEIKQLINAEGGMQIGDLLVIWKDKSKYILEILNKGTDANEHITSLFKEGERHFLIDQESVNDDFNVYGMHITQKNAAVENGHVCIGWSLLGDLTSVNTKDELTELYISKCPEHSPQKRSACVGQIWMFKNTMQIGDYVVFFDRGTAHIGKVIGDYEYLTDVPNQNPDYTNNRKVEWIRDIKYSDLSEEYRKSALTQRSIFTLNSYKGLISDILSGKDIMVDEGDGYEDEAIDDSATLPVFDYSASTLTDGQNLIVYGTPGCGKSYYVQNTLLKDCPNYIRTTFYQDYTNTDFVGQILPKVDGDKVTYEFNPGPFTLALELAIRKPKEYVALVIEELNRGSAASIFGDIFQLLDRKNGVSESAILNVNILEYLRKQFKGQYSFNEIKLPSNFSIFATMNTSDQNVFTLDTAFKRRWKFKKLLNKFNSDHKFKGKYVPGADVTWEEMVTAINEYILEYGSGLNSEDKQLGVYFVDETGMREEKVPVATEKEVYAFAYKVLEYLWDDVAKFDRPQWFGNDVKSLDQLVEKYKSNGIGIFSDGFKFKK